MLESYSGTKSGAIIRWYMGANTVLDSVESRGQAISPVQRDRNGSKFVISDSRAKIS
jgi:hypothetical protein